MSKATASKKTAKPQAQKEYEQEFARRRPKNIRFLVVLVLFILAMVATAVIVRINYIKGLAE